MAQFDNQTILITGAGYGIGKAAALAFGKEGGNVILAARSKEKMEMVAEELRGMGTRPLVVVTDVASQKDVTTLFEEIKREYGRLDVLVNNSGIAGPTKLARDIEVDEWQQTLDINLTGAFYCAKHASALMIEKGQGSIINISSVAGRIGYALRTPYAASKWGMIGLSHSLAAELGPYGIRVNVINPGPIAGDRINQVIEARAKAEDRSFEEIQEDYLTPMPLKRMPTESEVADAILFFASNSASSITGQVLHVDSGFRMQ